MSEQDSKMSGDAKIPLERSTAIGSRPQLNLKAASSDSLVQFFKSIPLFSLLEPSEVLVLLRVCHLVTYGAGETIFEEGEAADSMLIIERGEVSVTVRTSRGGMTVANLGDGSVVGEMALIVGAPRSASVRAFSETRVHRLDGRDFEILRREKSLAAYKILRKLLETLGDRRESVDGRIVDIFARPAEHIETFERHSRELAAKASKA
jgi:CRP-like cAMP-binding protein